MRSIQIMYKRKINKMGRRRKMIPRRLMGRRKTRQHISILEMIMNMRKVSRMRRRKIRRMIWIMILKK